MKDIEPLRMGVLGAADIAGRRMLPALSRVAGVALTAVASRDPARARDLTDRFGGTPVAGYRTLLDRDDVDVVYVPLPPSHHEEWIRRALLADKHVLAEKPATTSAAVTADLVELARRRGLVLAENHAFLMHPQHESVRRLLADGVVGDLRGVVAAFAFPPRPSGDIRYRADLGGGALLDAGTYPVRLASLVCGDELEVVGSVRWHDDDTGVDLAGDALLVRPDGVTAHLIFGFRHAYRSAYLLWGSRGRIVVERAFSPPPDHAPVIRIERDGEVEARTLPAHDQFALVLEGLVRAVRRGTPWALAGSSLVRQATLMERLQLTAVVRPSAPGAGSRP